jgi:uncharacterized membrane protein
MTKLLLSLHVLAALMAVGPVAVAASMFPAAVRRAQADGPDAAGRATVRVLHRVCRVYGAVAIAVPVFGFATADRMGVLGSAWLVTSIALTGVAAVLLVLLILPAQDDLVDLLDGDTIALERSRTARLAMLTGVFNLLWAAVTVLMIVRPGSTTGA